MAAVGVPPLVSIDTALCLTGLKSSLKPFWPAHSLNVALSRRSPEILLTSNSITPNRRAPSLPKEDQTDTRSFSNRLSGPDSRIHTSAEAFVTFAGSMAPSGNSPNWIPYDTSSNCSGKSVNSCWTTPLLSNRPRYSPSRSRLKLV